MNQDDMQKRLSPAKDREAKSNCHILFHPDYTVGPGVTPDLLTLKSRNFQSRSRAIPPVGNYTPP
jgi:hypothetical protein